MALTDAQTQALEDACTQAKGTARDQTVYEEDGVTITVKKNGRIYVELKGDDANQGRLDWTIACESKAVDGYMICTEPLFGRPYKIDFLPESES